MGQYSQLSLRERVAVDLLHREGLSVRSIAARLDRSASTISRELGAVHRIAMRIDDRFELVAGALDVDPTRGRAFAATLGIAPDRAYATYQELIDKEALRPDRVTPRARTRSATGSRPAGRTGRRCRRR